MAKKLVFEQFDSMDAFARSLDRPTNSVFARADLQSKGKSDPDWYGTKSYEEAMNLFRNGWDEKAEEIRKAFVQFEKVQERKVTYEKSRPATSVIGFTPHVPNAILGLPNSMIYTERTPMKAKVVRIVFNLGMNGGTSASTIMNAGLTVLKIAHCLEKKGMRVRIDVTPKFSYRNDETTVAMVCVKDWRQPVDIKKVAFPMAHPSMFRRLGFRWMETTPNLTERGFVGTYGRSFEDRNKEMSILKECGALKDTDYYMNVATARAEGFDIDRVAAAIGIKNL